MGDYESLFCVPNKELTAVGSSNIQILFGKVIKIEDKEYYGHVTVEVNTANQKNKKILEHVIVPKAFNGCKVSFAQVQVDTKVIVCKVGNGDAFLLHELHQKGDLPKENNDSPVSILLDMDGSNKFSIEGKSGKLKVTSTLAGFNLNIDEKEKSISIGDASGENQMSINSKDGEIKMISKNKIVFNVGGKEVSFLGEEIDCKSNLSIKSSGDIKLEGKKNCNVEAKSLGLKGTSGVKVEGSSVTIG